MMNIADTMCMPQTTGDRLCWTAMNHCYDVCLSLEMKNVLWGEDLLIYDCK